MEHLTCDICGKEMLLVSDVRYEIKMEVKAAYDPWELTKEDLEQDYDAKIKNILRELEGLSKEEAEEEVYKVFYFDLCRSCQQKYVRNLRSLILHLLIYQDVLSHGEQLN